MKDETPASILTYGELDLIRVIEAKRMDLLDEDEPLALRKRVRPARNQHTNNNRRRASCRVTEEDARANALRLPPTTKVWEHRFEGH